MISLEVHRIGVCRQLKQGDCLLELLPQLVAGLNGISAGDRLLVLYWMHELNHPDRRALQVHPRGDTSRPRCGVFSLRSPMRPNPIGVTEVQVLEVREHALLVSGLDAKDGSPIIDIKAACR